MKTYTEYMGKEHADSHPRVFEFRPYPGDGYNGYQRMKCSQCNMVIVKLDDKQTKTRNSVQDNWVLEHFLILEWP